MSDPIDLNSEVARMRAYARGPGSSEAAHRYAVRCQTQVTQDEDRRTLATVRLNGIVSRLAELSREFAKLELEVLAIADVLLP